MIKIGLVGCGRISSKHIDAIEKNHHLKLVSVCDIVKDKLDILNQKYKVSTYSDYDIMLENEKLDLISICTPSGLHPEMGIKAAKKKINILTEKPIGVDLKQIDKLIEAVKINNVKLFVVKQNRLNTTIQLLKKAVDKGRFGKIFMINSVVRWNRTQEYYDLSSWRGTAKLDGGAFLNQASHYIDAVQWLGGSVKSVIGITKTFNHKIEMEDSGIAILEFKNNIISNIEVTMSNYRKNWEGSITIMGEKGSAKVGGVAVNKIEYWDFEKYDDDDKLVLESNYEPTNIYGFGHLGYYQGVVKALLNNEDIQVGGEDGRKTVEIVNAIYQSSKLNKKIFL